MSDEADKRKARLKAMRERHAKAPAPAAAAAAAPAPAAAPAAGGGDSDFFDSLAGGGNAGGAGGMKGPMMQKLKKFLAKPDGSIDTKKAQMAAAFIKKQASDPSAPQHEMAQKIMAAIQNMNPQARKKLLAAMQGGAGGGGAAAAAPSAPAADASLQTGEGWFDDLVEKL